MADKLLISVSANQVSVARWRDANLGDCHVLANDEAGLAAFRDIVARLPPLPVHMMVDAVEEDYRSESLPHTFGSDRSEMVNRKLKQHYRNTPYCSARIQGRDRDKRRDDRYLFCALTNPELIAPWLQVITEHALPVAGIYLMPTVSAMLPEKLKLRQTNLLVVSTHGAGLRLTFFRDQQLRISRLARLDGSEGQVKNYAEEISNTRLYLHALRVMTLDEHLSVLLVDRDDTLTALAQTLALDNPNIDCRRIGHAEIVASVGIGAQSLDSSSDALYLHLMGLRAPVNNLAPAGVTLGYRQRQIRRGIDTLTTVCALAAGIWCAGILYQLFDAQREIEAARRETNQMQVKYREATEQFPAAPTTSDNLRRAVELSEKIGNTTRTPERMMDVVSQALDANPAIVMKNFGWKYGNTEIEAGGEKKSAPDASAPAARAAGRRQSGLIEGEVRPFNGDYRAAIDTINRFAAALSQQPLVDEIKVVKLPLNISPNLSLSGNTAESRGQIENAEFKLILVMKPAA